MHSSVSLSAGMDLREKGGSVCAQRGGTRAATATSSWKSEYKTFRLAIAATCFILRLSKCRDGRRTRRAQVCIPGWLFLPAGDLSSELHINPGACHI